MRFTRPSTWIWWRTVIWRVSTFMIGVTFVLVFIFILVDFSENSDNFADRGATRQEVIWQYYAPFIPEMVRLISPVALFITVLFHVGRMTERLELDVLKASGAKMGSIFAPFLGFGLLVAFGISWLDSEKLPQANQIRHEFEQEFLRSRSERLERGSVFRQLPNQEILSIQYYDIHGQYGYQAQIVSMDSSAIHAWSQANKISWIDSTKQWRLSSFEQVDLRNGDFGRTVQDQVDTTLFVTPEDLSRQTSDIYRLSYRDGWQYVESLERLGIGHIKLPAVQYFGRLFYPFSMVIVTLLGFGLAAGRRGVGRGVLIAVGLLISFSYLTIMKLAEPFGAAGLLTPWAAAAIPHLLFLLGAIVLARTVPK